LPTHDIVAKSFFDGLWTANDETALRCVAERAARQLGFSWFAYLGLGTGDPILISTYDRSWTDHYLDQGYERIDPVVRKARESRGPFAWSGEDPAILSSQPSRKLFAEARDFGIMSGVTLPVRGPFGQVAALTLAGETDAAELRRIIAASGETLQMLALYFHARVELTMRHRPAGSEPALSQREAECLGWAARGKTMSETAGILGVTTRTVVFHLENAREKLGASNVTQAVAKAVRARLIP